jgi:hypothetical protein
MAAFSSVHGDAEFRRHNGSKLTLALCLAFAAVIVIKSFIWYSAVQNLKQALFTLNARCAETLAPEFGWIDNGPLKILNNWSLPSLALIVQDTRPRKLLLAPNDCSRFHDSGLIPIDPWTKISAHQLRPALE